MKDNHISSFILFVLSMLYLCAELVFNTLMLDVAGTSNSTYEQIDSIQYLGRSISASGFTLLMLGLFVKSGFVLKTGRQWLLALAVTFLCLTPLFMTYGDMIISTFRGTAMSDAALDTEMHWSFIALFGCMLIFYSKGERRDLFVLGLIIMAWSSMFLGQKLLVERYIVSPTTWEERLNARYMLMARHYAEECQVKLGDLHVCHAATKDEDLRSLNAVLPSFLAFSGTEVAQDIHRQKDTIIWNLIRKENWFSVDAAYQRYLHEIDALDQVMQEKMNAALSKYAQNKNKYKEGVYHEYVQASQLYYRALDTRAVEKLAKKIWKKIDKEQESGWRIYKREAGNYNTTITGLARDMKQKLDEMYYGARACRSTKCEQDKRQAYNDLFLEYPEYGKKIEQQCGGNVLEYKCKLTEDDIAAYMHAEKDPEFLKKSGGYPPDIQGREAFLTHSKTRAALDKAMQERFEEEMRAQGATDYGALPQLRRYEDLEKYFKDGLIRKANQKWQQQIVRAMGVYMDPGLEMEAFFAALDADHPIHEFLEYAPAFEKPDIPVLSKDAFVKKYIWPEYEKKMREKFLRIEGEAPDYANRKQKSEEGKDYIRAVFIPPIALGLSLLISILTIGKNIIFLFSYAGRYVLKQEGWTPKTSALYYTVMWAGFFIGFGGFVSLCTNPYTQSDGYTRYYAAVHRERPVTAFALDAIIRVQPAIYAPGTWLVDKGAGIARP